jgi:hypothetical protein
MAKEIKKYLDYGNGYMIDITNDTGLAEFFPAPKNLKGQWVYPKLVIVKAHFITVPEEEEEKQCGTQTND